MSSCSCDKPTTYRATCENGGGSYFYLRCAECGGKAGTVSFDEKEFRKNITEPDNVDDVVSIKLEPGDNPFIFLGSQMPEDGDEIAEHYGKRHIRDQDYWVYVLDCRTRFWCDNYEDLKRRAEKRLGRVPDWLRMAWEARSNKYVGQTENIFKRLGEHLEQNRTTDFTTLFEPTRVDFLEPVNSRRMAERREEKIGKSYYDKDDVYAYWK